jgi:hypothetical protein
VAGHVAICGDCCLVSLAPEGYVITLMTLQHYDQLPSLTPPPAIPVIMLYKTLLNLDSESRTHASVTGIHKHKRNLLKSASSDCTTALLVYSRSSGNLSHFKYLGKTVTNQNLIHEEIEVRLNNLSSRTRSWGLLSL